MEELSIELVASVPESEDVPAPRANSKAGASENISWLFDHEDAQHPGHVTRYMGARAPPPKGDRRASGGD